MEKVCERRMEQKRRERTNQEGEHCSKYQDNARNVDEGETGVWKKEGHTSSLQEPGYCASKQYLDNRRFTVCV